MHSYETHLLHSLGWIRHHLYKNHVHKPYSHRYMAEILPIRCKTQSNISPIRFRNLKIYLIHVKETFFVGISLHEIIHVYIVVLFNDIDLCYHVSNVYLLHSFFVAKAKCDYWYWWRIHIYLAVKQKHMSKNNINCHIKRHFPIWNFNSSKSKLQCAYNTRH